MAQAIRFLLVVLALVVVGAFPSAAQPPSHAAVEVGATGPERAEEVKGKSGGAEAGPVEHGSVEVDADTDPTPDPEPEPSEPSDGSSGNQEPAADEVPPSGDGAQSSSEAGPSVDQVPIGDTPVVEAPDPVSTPEDRSSGGGDTVVAIRSARDGAGFGEPVIERPPAANPDDGLPSSSPEVSVGPTVLALPDADDQREIPARLPVMALGELRSGVDLASMPVPVRVVDAVGRAMTSAGRGLVAPASATVTLVGLTLLERRRRRDLG